MRQNPMYVLCLGALALSACSFTPPAETPAATSGLQAVPTSIATAPTASPAGAPSATTPVPAQPTPEPTLVPATAPRGAVAGCAALATVDPQSEQGLALVSGLQGALAALGTLPPQAAPGIITIISQVDGWLALEFELPGSEPAIFVLEQEGTTYAHRATWGGLAEYPGQVSRSLRRQLPDAPAAFFDCLQPQLPVFRADGVQMQAWEGFLVPVPPGYRWELLNPEPAELSGAPIVSAGRLIWTAVEGTQASSARMISFTRVRFSGTPQEWRDAEARALPGSNPVYPALGDAVTIGGEQGLAYQLPGIAGDSRLRLVAPLDGDLVLIDLSHPEHADQQMVLHALE